MESLGDVCDPSRGLMTSNSFLIIKYDLPLIYSHFLSGVLWDFLEAV